MKKPILIRSERMEERGQELLTRRNVGRMGLKRESVVSGSVGREENIGVN